MYHTQSEEGRTSVKKKGCQWLYTTHDEAHYDAAVSTGQEQKVFKIYAFIIFMYWYFSVGQLLNFTFLKQLWKPRIMSVDQSD